MTNSGRVIGISVSKNTTGPLLFTKIGFFFEHFINATVGKYSQEKMTEENGEGSKPEDEGGKPNDECESYVMTDPLLIKKKSTAQEQSVLDYCNFWKIWP